MTDQQMSKIRVYRPLCPSYFCILINHNMHHHIEIVNTYPDSHNKLASMIRSGEITLGGYKKAKIYGLLSCRSGKRMNIRNRVFFRHENEALRQGYRPCGHCMPEKYQLWKLSKEEYLIGGL